MKFFIKSKECLNFLTQKKNFLTRNLTLALFHYYATNNKFFITKVYQLLKLHVNPVFFPEFIYFNFKNRKLHISLQTSSPHYIYFTLSPGLLLAKFFLKKSLKKKNKIKILSTRFLRKLLLLLEITLVSVRVRGLPFGFGQYLRQLYTPVIHNFLNPFSNLILNDTFSSKTQVQVISFLLKKGAPITQLKTRRRGRIKRKVLRKLIHNNSLTD